MFKLISFNHRIKKETFLSSVNINIMLLGSFVFLFCLFDIFEIAIQ